MIVYYYYYYYHPRMSPPWRWGAGGGGLACLNNLTDYAGGNYMFLVGPPKADSP